MLFEEKVAFKAELAATSALDIIRNRGIDKNLLDKTISFLKKDGFDKDFRRDGPGKRSRGVQVYEIVEGWVKDNKIKWAIEKRPGTSKLADAYIHIAAAHLLKLGVSTEEQVFAIENKFWEEKEEKVFFRGFKDAAEYFSRYSQYKTLYLLLVEALKAAGFDGPVKDKELHKKGVGICREAEQIYKRNLEMSKHPADAPGAVF